MAKKITQYDLRRRTRRDRIWPEAGDLIYHRNSESGFITIPRTLSMICTLVKLLGGKRDPSRVYFELWTRQRDDGFVEIDDPDELAQVCGFWSPSRAVRSLREALSALSDLGFIRLAPKGQRKFAFALILHPHDVVQRIRHEEPRKIPSWWWALFEMRTDDIGARLRWEPPFGEFPDDL